MVAETFGYATLKSPHAEVREVNQSPPDRRRTRGTKCFSMLPAECWLATLQSDSTALSLTIVSSTFARVSKGGWKTDGHIQQKTSQSFNFAIHVFNKIHVQNLRLLPISILKNTALGNEDLMIIVIIYYMFVMHMVMAVKVINNILLQLLLLLLL